MASPVSVDEYLKSLCAVSDDAGLPVISPQELSAASLRLFLQGDNGPERESSSGLLHITGGAVNGNTAPVRAVGGMLTSFQAAVDAVGASLQGFTSLGGAIRQEVAARTEMSVVASPLPGSVVIEVAPTMDRQDDLYPNGEALFDVETTADARPLADLAISELFSLLSECSLDEPVTNEFVDHLASLGPRAASSVRGFCDVVGKNDINVEMQWKEPRHVAIDAAISSEYARYVAKAIENARIDVEVVTLEGTLRTVTSYEKDKLRLVTDDGTQMSIAIGKIEPAALALLHVDQRVVIKAERHKSTRPGGRLVEKLVGLSIEAAPEAL